MVTSREGSFFCNSGTSQEALGFALMPEVAGRKAID